MRLIDADKIILDYSGLIYIDPLDFRGTAEYFANQIKEMPTIEPERKTGQWLPDNNNYYEERYICSACKRSYKVDTCMGKPIWNYCPCGAKMEEGDQK